MVPFIFALIYCMPSLSSAAEKEQTFRALSFGKTTGDYIQFTPADMSPFQSSFTGCAWIKNQHDASYGPMILHLGPRDQIIMGSNGYWNKVKTHLDLSGRFPEKNVWFHYCLSWSAGGEQKVYVNGEEVGSRSASSSNLTMGGDISLGLNAQSSKGSSYIFGGQLFKLNLFSEVLSSSEIRQMSEAGMCSSIEMRHETRKLKWERILTEPRYGNVTEFVPEECSVGYLMKKLDDTTRRLEETQEDFLDRDSRLNQTYGQLQQVMTILNSTVDTMEETSLQLNNSLDQLKEAKNEIKEKEKTLNDTQLELTETQAQLLEAEGALEELDARLNESLSRQEECGARLNESLTRQEECDARLNESLSRQEQGRNLDEVSRWDILYTSPYLNKLFSRKLYHQLIGSWGMMENFIGVNITTGFVQHFKQHHEEHQLLDEE